MDEDRARQLIGRLKRGDASAAESLVRLCEPFVYGWLTRRHRLAGHDADDVYQRVFERLWQDDWRRLRIWQGTGTFTAFLAVVVRNAVNDWHRARRPATETVEFGNTHRAAPDHDPDDDPGYESMRLSELKDSLHGALEKLASRDRLLIEHFYLLDESYERIGDDLQMTVNNVGVALNRAKRRLRNLLPREIADLVHDDLDRRRRNR